MTISYETLCSEIKAIAKAERITKTKLGAISRTLLQYLIEEEDVRPVNMLLGKDERDNFLLTPVNWRIAVQYFAHFLPFTSNYEKEVKQAAIKGGERVPLVFLKKNKRKWDDQVAQINAWLADEGNDLWVWSNNAEIEAKPVDYRKQITNAVKKALDEGKGGMSLVDVFESIMEADVDMAEMFVTLQGMNEDAQEQQEAA